MKTNLINIITDTIKPYIENYGYSANDVALLYLRVDAFLESLFPFILSVVVLFIVYYILDKVFRTEKDACANLNLVRALLQDFDTRSYRDNDIILDHFGVLSQKVDKMTMDEILRHPPVKKWQLDEESVPQFFIGCCSLIIGVTYIIKAVTALSCGWAWIGMFYPGLYAVHLGLE